jgi:hypothetical protein
MCFLQNKPNNPTLKFVKIVKRQCLSGFLPKLPPVGFVGFCWVLLGMAARSVGFCWVSAFETQHLQLLTLRQNPKLTFKTQQNGAKPNTNPTQTQQTQQNPT